MRVWIAFPGASFFRTLNPKNLKIEPLSVAKVFRVSHRLDDTLEPLATTNCDDISRERSRVHRKCFDKVLDALVRYYARFVVESWSERGREREREEEREKKKKKESVVLSLSLRKRRRDFLVFFAPLCWKRERERERAIEG